jgi:glucose-1-phosphate adenylyltransferase
VSNSLVGTGEPSASPTPRTLFSSVLDLSPSTLNPPRSVLALILAGGEGGRLGPLTVERAKPALPFGGTYRLIDFPLSNSVHSGLSDVWVLQQYEPHDLTSQLAGGRPWDLDRTRGGFRIVHPYLGDSESGWYKGNADALQRNRELIGEFDPELLLVLSADHIYKADYGEVIEGHLASDAELTMVTTQVPLEEASRYGVLEIGEGETVNAFEYKPEQPKSGTVTTEVFLYDTRALLETLCELDDVNSEDGLQDFGDELIPRLVSERRARAHRLDGYWRDVGTPESYWQAHMDLLAKKPRLILDDPGWPILTTGLQRPPARVESSARIDSSWVAPGAVVAGQVERSIVGPGVAVADGAVVRDSVLFHDARVERGATLERVIGAEAALIGRDATLGDARGDVTLIGDEAVVEEGQSIPAGTEVARKAGST